MANHGDHLIIQLSCNFIFFKI